MSVTSVDVARAAGVSQATVSRVLHNSDKVGAATRRRVLDAVASTGYSPNLIARAMKTKRTGTVGVVVSQITNPFYPEALVALGRALAVAGQRMVLFDSEETEDAALDSITQGLVDGVIFTSGTTESEALRIALDLGAPVVLLNRSVPGLAGDQVTSDNAAGAAAVARFLVELGHRRIGFIGGPALPSTVTERRESFASTLVGLGHPLDPTLSRSGPLSYSQGKRGVAELLALDHPPTAVFCVNDVTAFGALDAAREAKVSVPGDLSIVGYDDVEMAGWTAFDLTTVRQPVAGMADRAVQLLMQRITDPVSAARHERFPAELVVRGTTAKPGTRS
jgi:LacI family transcriptional regulator